MAGLYIHIPFCKQACHYCDFHFSTSMKMKGDIVKAIAHEMALQQSFLQGESLQTIYFGGGTPSLLNREELTFLLREIYRQFKVSDQAEITLEANPDDLEADKLRMLKAAGINRLSIGIQSFHEQHLSYLNRAHNSQEAINCILEARKAGFQNISIDLIYAIPSPDDKLWREDLQTVLELRPEHISSYCLTIEDRTAFGNWLKKGKIKAVSDEYAAHQFEILMEELRKAGYQHYEISNFCLPGHHSRHNSNYWKQQKYLGLGPAAHSYDGTNRQFNVANNAKYLKAINQDQVPFELDPLRREDRINEALLTGLRTSWGVNLEQLHTQYDYELLKEQKTYLEQLFDKQLAEVRDQHLVLSDQGKLLADKIASDLFVV